MAVTTTEFGVPVAAKTSGGSYVEWGAVFAGAIATLAVSFVLLTFGAAVGLSAVSPWNTSRTAATAVGIGSAFWILLVSLWSFALGGYLAARLRHKWAEASRDEVDFRDNAHGMLAWALAVFLAVVIASLAASGRTVVSDSSATGSVAAVTAVDTVVRTTRADVPPANDALRGEVARALVSNLGNPDLPAADRAYLSGLVASRTGLAPPEAERRVNEAFTQFKQSTDRARKGGIIMAFLTAATLLVGGATAWWAASVGGRHRDEGTLWHAFRRYRVTTT